MKKVYTAATEVEAMMLYGILEDAGIPAVLRSHLVPGYGARIPPGWGDLIVPDTHLDEARALIAAYLDSLKEEQPS